MQVAIAKRKSIRITPAATPKMAIQMIKMAIMAMRSQRRSFH